MMCAPGHHHHHHYLHHHPCCPTLTAMHLSAHGQTFLTVGLGDYSVSWSGNANRALLEVATFVAGT
jgi:hypothetical protein